MQSQCPKKAEVSSGGGLDEPSLSQRQSISSPLQHLDPSLSRPSCGSSNPQIDLCSSWSSRAVTDTQVLPTNAIHLDPHVGGCSCFADEWLLHGAFLRKHTTHEDLHRVAFVTTMLRIGGLENKRGVHMVTSCSTIGCHVKQLSPVAVKALFWI